MLSSVKKLGERFRNISSKELLQKQSMDNPSARVQAGKALVWSHLGRGTSAWEQENGEEAGRQRTGQGTATCTPPPTNTSFSGLVSETGQPTETSKKSRSGHFITNPTRSAEPAVQVHPEALSVSSCVTQEAKWNPGSSGRNFKGRTDVHSATEASFSPYTQC